MLEASERRDATQSAALQTEQRNAFSFSSPAQLAVKRREFTPAALGKFQVSGVVSRQAVLLCQLQGGSPGVLFCLGVGEDSKGSQIKQRSISESNVILSAEHVQLEHICDFEVPDRRYPHTFTRDPLEDVHDGVSALCRVNPGNRYGCVENEAHGLPKSRSFFISSQEKSPSSVNARRSMLATAS